jgi:hypothetical protein
MNSVRPSAPPQRTGEAPAVEIDCLQYLPAFSCADAALVGDVRVPDRAFVVEADAVRGGGVEVGPDPAIRQAAVALDIESGEPARVGLSEDQRRSVGCYRHAVGECHVVCHLACRAVGGDHGEDAGGGIFAGHHVEADAVEVDVPASGHDDLVPGTVAQASEVGVGNERPVGLLTQQKPIAARDDEQATVR